MLPEIIPLNRSVEGRLLLCCAQAHANSDAAQRIKELLAQKIDWSYLIRKAAWHGLIPLLYWNLRGADARAIPPDLWERLKAHFEWNTRRCLFLTGELFKIIDLLSEHGIKTCPFKGPLLSVPAYGNIGLRSFGDLDILVPRQSIHKAVQLLAILGYQRPVAPQESDELAPEEVDPEQIGYLQAQFYTLTREIPGSSVGPIRVDLQWRISETHFAFSLDSEERWNQLQTITILNRELHTFQLDDLFLILCVHGCKHYWYRLKWLCDIAEILRLHPSHDWSRCLTMAHALGVERMIKLAVLLARDLLQAPVPPQLASMIKSDARVRSNARWISRRLFAEADGRISEAQAFYFYLSMKDRWLDSLRHCWVYLTQLLSAIVTPTRKERALVRLPGFLHFLYYFIRPLRLGARHARSAWSRAGALLKISRAT